ncbi:hypothetical protein ACKWTF_012978 [Chironomus riparius]
MTQLDPPSLSLYDERILNNFIINNSFQASHEFTHKMTTFTRPNALPFPTIYHKFQAKDKDSDELVEYRVQDLLEEDYENGIDMMISEYCPEESFNKCRGVANNAEAVKEKRNIWRKHINKRLSVGCYKSDESNELVGVCVFSVHVKSASDSPFMFKTAHNRDVSSIVDYIKDQYDVYSNYGTDKYLTDYGMMTKKTYRHRGIAVELLKARTEILKSLDVDVTSTIFTVIGSQKAAVKANYEEVYAVKWTDVAEHFPDFDFSKADCEYCKIFVLKVNKN